VSSSFPINSIHSVSHVFQVCISIKRIETVGSSVQSCDFIALDGNSGRVLLVCKVCLLCSYEIVPTCA
jgi:hypothetical protein